MSVRFDQQLDSSWRVTLVSYGGHAVAYRPNGHYDSAAPDVISAIGKTKDEALIALCALMQGARHNLPFSRPWWKFWAADEVQLDLTTSLLVVAE